MPKPKERPAGKQCRFVLGVSKHQGNQRTWCPRPRRGLLPCNAVSSSVCLNIKMNRDVVFTLKEKVSRRIALLLPRVYLHQDVWLSTDYVPFSPWRPRPREAPPRLPSRCLNTKVVGSFLTEPCYLFLAFPYIIIKTQDNVCSNWPLLDLIKKPRKRKKSVPLNCTLHRVFN